MSFSALRKVPLSGSAVHSVGNADVKFRESRAAARRRVSPAAPADRRRASGVVAARLPAAGARGTG